MQRVVGMVGIIGWPVAGSAAPTEVRSGNKMHDARRAIPGRAHVVFRVRVVGERLALGVEVDTVRITESAGHEFPPRAVAVSPNQTTFRRALPAACFAKRRRAIENVLGWDLNRIAVDAVDHPVRAGICPRSPDGPGVAVDSEIVIGMMRAGISWLPTIAVNRFLESMC